MLDTIRVKYPISPTPEQLKNWTKRISINSMGGIRETYMYNPKITDDNVMVKYTYYPIGYDSKPLFTLEVSLPKMIYGTNFRMIGSIDETINISNVLLSDVPHVPILDLAEGLLIRLDICYNHQVGDLVDDYIIAIGNLDYPHRRTKHHRYEGAEFRSKHKTTKFYNKQTEIGTPDAYGILRQETTILRGQNVQKLLGTKKPTLLDITPELVKNQLEDDLKKLRLLDNVITNQDTALKMLCDKYGSDAGIYYFGVLVSRLTKSKKRIANETKMHPRSLDRRLRNIVDAGIAPTLTDREEPLPPLNINFNHYQSSPSKSHFVPSSQAS